VATKNSSVCGTYSKKLLEKYKFMKYEIRTKIDKHVWAARDDEEPAVSGSRANRIAKMAMTNNAIHRNTVHT
jgi:hypothetical protein